MSASAFHHSGTSLSPTLAASFAARGSAQMQLEKADPEASETGEAGVYASKPFSCVRIKITSRYNSSANKNNQNRLMFLLNSTEATSPFINAEITDMSIPYLFWNGRKHVDVSAYIFKRQRNIAFISDERETTPLQHDDLLEKVLPEIETYFENGWDGENANPVRQKTVHLAQQILRTIEGKFCLPDTEVAEDGSICMEWVSDNGVVWLDVNDDGTVSVMLKIDGTKNESHFTKMEKSTKEYILHILANIFSNTSYNDRSLQLTSA
ncbi:hypothetical protein [Ferruginivarius sediminum]|uniref:hypothetical protein n=1 Tax=Ferruginivarius sediminum TaxID=2661937 RepID=UPI0011C0529F|nr:hypothetical protein [Ferruginivarius sediminum]